MIDVSVITVTHESQEFIADQILSVSMSALHFSVEQIIIDNGSTDGTAELIQKGYLNYVRLIRNQKNRGFAAANNQALLHAKGRYLLFLNPDMRLELGSLDKLIPWMDTHPKAGIVGCKLLDREGCDNVALHPRRFPPCIVHVAFFLRLQRFFPTLMKRFEYISFDPDKEQEVDSVRGSFMLVKREVVKKLGRAFDPRYFLLFEDLDFCKEARQMDYQIWYTPLISSTDLFHRSFLHHSRIWKHWQMSRSLFVYACKWYGWGARFLIATVIPFGILLRIPRWLFRWNDSFGKRA